MAEKLKKATFAGGCFWCMEGPFEQLDGVLEVISGYTGGTKENPTYEEVGSGTTGHVEAVQIVFAPSKVDYSKLLEVYWMQIDPTDAGGQFVDRGFQYTTAVFYHDAEQKKLAEKSKAALGNSGRYPKPVVTPIKEAGPFYKAEDYHQDYYTTNPLRYKFYRYNSGRDSFLKKVWKERTDENSSKKDLKKQLTPLQYQVTQEDGTEKSFDNEYWNNKRDGIYVDIVSGEPLFSSKHKYDSRTGWPSFWQPLQPSNIITKEDRGFFTVRTEVRSKGADSHLGHVFPDGPQPTGLRYCINSASLRFIPKEDLEKEGYGEYRTLFE